MTTIYPWQTGHWELLRARAREHRLAHGLLFAGPAGTGKTDFASTLAGSLLCKQPSDAGFACGSCSACQLIQAGTHPDLLNVSPPEDKTQILIDQVRELCRGLALKSHAGGHKVAIVSPAEQMNTSAANSLLKTLEEPTDNTLLILITDQPTRLPATIRSRCQQIRFPVPGFEQGKAWLESHAGSTVESGLLLRLADGAPLRAMALQQSGVIEDRCTWLDQLIVLRRGQSDPARIAATWAEDPEMRPLYWFGSFLADLIRLGQGSPSLIKNIDLRDKLHVLFGFTTPLESHCLLTRAWQDFRLARQTSVNRPLMMEGLLIDWARGGHVRRAMA